MRRPALAGSAGTRTKGQAHAVGIAAASSGMVSGTADPSPLARAFTTALDVPRILGGDGLAAPAVMQAIGKASASGSAAVPRP